ncbi:aldehyde dehydrogenase [Dichomitus squalens]|uniref:Aldehyde dehydrogenase n=1 Tax=Dichomitus squalens TaxID=114155 RepID=A0A4V2K0X4_9APHY|nr:aldehyde dehydrogenase [Dichomitus squalens]
MSSIPFTGLFIDGEWRPASTGATFGVLNPATGKVIGTSASASADDCVAAIEAAARAFKTWEHSPLPVRRDVFLRAAELLATGKYKAKVAAATKEELAASADMFWMNHTVQINHLRNFAGAIQLLKGETFPSVVPGGQVFAQRRALGVIFGIAPWNAPTGLCIRAIAIPLICGNTVVLKSSEECPRTHAVIVELFEEAGLPKGVLNFISVSKEDVSARVSQIIAHPSVRKINFTGSDRVGSIIAAEAARHLKQCVLELGGKAPVIVLDDADVRRAARAITSSALLQSGQICMSTERVIIQRAVAPALVEELTALFGKGKAGDPGTEPSANLGPLFTEGAAENVLAMIQEAVTQGAQVILGDLVRQGAYVQPHIVMNARPGMRLWERESFGPVVAVAVVDTVDEAVDLANACDYSMTSAVWTKDVYRAFDVAGRIHAACANINGPTIHVEFMRDLGGLGGASGYGHFRVEDWTAVRMVVLHPKEEPPYILLDTLNATRNANGATNTVNVTNGSSHLNGTSQTID